jgi:hypothetical protein
MQMVLTVEAKAKQHSMEASSEVVPDTRAGYRVEKLQVAVAGGQCSMWQANRLAM